MVCSVIVLATNGVNSLPVPSTDLAIAAQNRNRGTRWGRSVNPEDLKDPENRQQIDDNELIFASLLKREIRSVPEVVLEIAQNRYRGTRWGRSVIPDQNLQVAESRPVGNYAGHTGAFRKVRSVEEDFVMAARKNKRPGGHYSKTRWGRSTSE